MQTPWDDLEVSDAHVHFFSRRFFASLGSQCGKSAPQTADALGFDLPGDDPVELARVWAAELDRHGVARAALISSVPGDEASVIAAAAAFPDRFYAYAMMNPMAENTVAPGLHAICLFPAMHRYSIQDPRVRPLLDQADAKGCAVFVHCGVLTVGARKKLGLPSHFDMHFSNPIDVHRVAMDYPRVRFVVPHFGAGFFREALMLADLCPNVYLDTSSGNTWMRYEGLDLRAVFSRALAVAGAGRLLFGSDSSFFPRGWVRNVYEFQSVMLAEMGIRSDDAAAIFGGNLQKIMRTAPAVSSALR
jgi:predicted TIM-barrel fold metal-dependent hydrolase